MSHRSILVICADPCRLESLRADLPRWATGNTVALATAEEAFMRPDFETFSLILVDLSSIEGDSKLEGLIDACQAGPFAVPIVAIADWHDETEALSLFQLGVDDYLSLAHHRERLGWVIDQLVENPRPVSAGASSAPARSLPAMASSSA